MLQCSICLHSARMHAAYCMSIIHTHHTHTHTFILNASQFECKRHIHRCSSVTLAISIHEISVVHGIRFLLRKSFMALTTFMMIVVHENAATPLANTLHLAAAIHFCLAKFSHLVCKQHAQHNQTYFRLHPFQMYVTYRHIHIIHTHRETETHTTNVGDNNNDQFRRGPPEQ